MIQINLPMAKAVLSLIDVCAERGAFKGTELEMVGQLRRDIFEAAKPLLQAEEAAKADEKTSGITEEFKKLQTTASEK